MGRYTKKKTCSERSGHVFVSANLPHYKLVHEPTPTSPVSPSPSLCISPHLPRCIIERECVSVCVFVVCWAVPFFANSRLLLSACTSPSAFSLSVPLLVCLCGIVFVWLSVPFCCFFALCAILRLSLPQCYQLCSCWSMSITLWYAVSAAAFLYVPLVAAAVQLHP